MYDNIILPILLAAGVYLVLSGFCGLLHFYEMGYFNHHKEDVVIEQIKCDIETGDFSDNENNRYCIDGKWISQGATR